MARLEHIVVGIDEERLADTAVTTALHLSRLVEAPMRVVHAVHNRSERPWFADEGTLLELQRDALGAARRSRTDHLWKLLQPFAVTHQEIDEMLRVASGRPAALLAARAVEHDGAVIVVGGHKHRGLLDTGGTTRELLANPVCPIWVQDTRPWREIRRILLAIDLSPGSAPILNLAKQLAAAAGARVTALHCFETPTYAYVANLQIENVVDQLEKKERAEFDAFMAREGDPSVEPEFVSGDPAATLLGMQDGFDVVVMGTHGHSGVARALLGNHAHRILSDVETPLVIVPQPNIAPVVD